MTQQYLLQFFAYEHLPPHLQEVSKPFGELAQQIEASLPQATPKRRPPSASCSKQKIAPFVLCYLNLKRMRKPHRDTP
jgi:hypothetical protein